MKLLKLSTKEEIVIRAQEISFRKLNWHFHLLTPDCVFNVKPEYALVFENSSGDEVLVNYSATKQEKESKALLELLHGIKADELQPPEGKVSPAVRKMEKRAKELIEKGIIWHHHALFPDCIYNKSKGKWVLMLEDPETNKVLESKTDDKPEADLKIIEPLFYHQHK
jgi:hypothetical protein